MNQPLTVIYVAWGNDEVYHSGVLFNWLRLTGLGYAKGIDQAVVYTDQPSYYANYPMTVRALTPSEMQDWTLDGRYFFRIKTKVLAEAISQFGGKVLHIDSDILIKRPLREVFEHIAEHQSLFAANEGPLCADYLEILETERSDFLNFYDDTSQVNMYCSALTGVSSRNLPAVLDADGMMVHWLKKTTAHTVEQFAISESLLRHGNKLTSATGWFDDFNSKGKKAYAKLRIAEFFSATQGMSFEEKAKRAATWRVQRTPWVWLKQKLKIGI
jgi:hypothetical protein